MYDVQRTCPDGSSFKWHPPCKNQTAQQPHHLSGYSKCAVKSDSHSFSPMQQERSESARERRTALFKVTNNNWHLLPDSGLFFSHPSGNPQIAEEYNTTVHSEYNISPGNKSVSTHILPHEQYKPCKNQTSQQHISLTRLLATDSPATATFTHQLHIFYSYTTTHRLHPLSSYTHLLTCHTHSKATPTL